MGDSKCHELITYVHRNLEDGRPNAKSFGHRYLGRPRSIAFFDRRSSGTLPFVAIPKYRGLWISTRLDMWCCHCMARHLRLSRGYSETIQAHARPNIVLGGTIVIVSAYTEASGPANIPRPALVSATFALARRHHTAANIADFNKLSVMSTTRAPRILGNVINSRWAETQFTPNPSGRSAMQDDVVNAVKPGCALHVLSILRSLGRHNDDCELLRG